MAVVTVLLGLLTTSPMRADGATTLDAMQFFANCAAATAGSPGYYAIPSTKVSGALETGAHFGSCKIALNEGATLSMAHLYGGWATISELLIYNGPKAKVKLDDAGLNVSGSLRIEPGTGPVYGPGSSVAISKSTLQADEIKIRPSCNSDDGKATIKESGLYAVHSLVISPSAVCTGSPPVPHGGKADVSKNTLSVPNGTLAISTGFGSVKATKNQLSYFEGSIHSADKCTAKDNTPDVHCT